MKKTRQPTEVAKTLSGGDSQEDTVAKRLFSINEIIAWILKLCIEEFSTIDVQNIVNELRGEKIDIVKFNTDPAQYVANALSPAQVISAVASETDKICWVVVPDYQLSLAIGKEGQNARLAAKLTGWKIDIKPESQVENDEAVQEGSGEET